MKGDVNMEKIISWKSLLKKNSKEAREDEKLLNKQIDEFHRSLNKSIEQLKHTS